MHILTNFVMYQEQSMHKKKIDIHLIAIKVHMFRWKGAVLANP